MKKESDMTGGELSKKALADNTNYNCLELGHAITDEIDKELRKCIEKYKPIFDEDEWCVVMQLAKDPLIVNLKRRKFYGWLYLPSPRPDQSVFLYNRRKDVITKRLWVLPTDARMAQLASVNVVPDNYKTMQAWSIAFFQGKFWDYIRYEHDINMPSEHEYFLQHREELIKAGCKLPTSNDTEPFDFSKVQIKKVVDPKESLVE